MIGFPGEIGPDVPKETGREKLRRKMKLFLAYNFRLTPVLISDLTR
jgi:hypothetical protein